MYLTPLLRLTIGVVLPSSLAGEFLRRAARHHFVEQRLLLPLLSQKATQTLHMLADTSGSREDDADVGRGDIDPLVEDLAGDEDGIFAGMEAEQDVAAFPGLGLVRNRRHEETAGDLINGGI